MASNNDSVGVATWRDYDPAAATAAEQKPEPKAPAARTDKKEN